MMLLILSFSVCIYILKKLNNLKLMNLQPTIEKAK